MTEKRIFDYKENDKFDIFVLIKSAEVKTTKNGDSFISFTFTDKSGDVTGMYWNASTEDVEHFQPGKVVLLSGQRTSYQNKPQVKINGMRLAKDTEPNNPSDYVQYAPESQQQMQDELKGYLEKITKPEWNKVVRYLLNHFYPKFFQFPAAKKNHHAFAGGLAYHTLSILRLAKAVSDQYDFVNRELLYAGAILHDMAKTIEMTGALNTQYTVEGNMIGHIVLIDEEIVRACDELNINKDDEDMILLRHMILSHHGLMEYGSPVRPHIMEAEILHHLDDLDASIQMIKGALDHTELNEFSEYIYGMDGRNFYKYRE